MKLSKLFEGYTPSADYKGAVTADDMFLAIDTSETQGASDSDYAVAQTFTKSVTASLNPETTQTAYIRAGKSTTKTGNQRTISFEMDRYVGDDFQDYVDSKKYATGEAAVVNYIYGSLLTGKGEKGQATISLDTDGSGNAEESLAISGSLEKTGAAPDEWIWSTSGN